MSVETNAYDIPVILFVFRRLDTVKMIVEKLKEVEPQKLYIFSDGARSGNEEEQRKVQAVRDYIDSAITWKCNLHREYATKNKGCAKNICEGIDYVFTKESKAVILEDDAVPMKEFFIYCKSLLDRYNNDKRIQYIAGFNAIGDCDCIKESYAFSYTAPMSGAIATWADRWNECDFSMKSWPEKKKKGAFRKYFFSHEMYHQICKAFDDSYKNINDGWDYQFQYDMLDKERFAIVPRRNLVRSYGYVLGAFHVQERKVAQRLKPLMDYTKDKYSLPMKEPKKETWDREYDRIRQKYYLSVNGNYFIRHLKYLKRSTKDIAYKYLPSCIWKVFKQLLK